MIRALAAALKPELDRRFNKPVRYIIYSHHDFDHAEGAAVYGPGAVVVAHENVAKNLDGQLHRLAGGNLDLNHNGKLDKDEASGGYLSNFDRLDRNHDGAITPDELNFEIRKPDITYTGRLTLTLGGKTVQVIYPGRNREFLEDLSAAVSKGIADGKSLDEIKRTVTLDKYSKWPNLKASLPNVIEQACNNLRNYP